MNDEETVALIAGGHTFGKCHGAGDAALVGPEPEGASIEEQGLGWKSGFGSGKGDDTITSGIEGAWTPNPTRWDIGYFDTLLGYEWELVKSPAGAWQWTPKNASADGTVPDAHDPSKRHAPDDAHDGPLAEAGPDLRADFEALPRASRSVRRCLRPGVVQADPPRHGSALALPRPGGPCGGAALAGPRSGSRSRTDRRAGHRDLKARILASGLSISQLVSTAWASASTFRGSDKRGGANGARIRLAPQKDWEVNQPAQLAIVLQSLEGIQQDVQRLRRPAGRRFRSPT